MRKQLKSELYNDIRIQYVKHDIFDGIKNAVRYYFTLPNGDTKTSHAFINKEIAQKYARQRVRKILPKINKSQLDTLRKEWRKMANDIFVRRFGHTYQDFGSVIGAGVQIGKNRKFIEKWYGSGMTGEQEAFDKIKPKLEKLGYNAWYNPGRLD